ncbi:RidA family protein [Mesorhizobium sp. M0659]|uniref:RidA family protein n=1 Tax=Mesorhizobium sp. M0659 TaxID=2956980 RepID=UPI003337D1FD
MIRNPVNPASLYDSLSLGFSHAVEQHGGRTLHLAGQVAYDSARALVGAGDLVLQTRQALKNLRLVLAEMGATPANIVRLRTYVVDHNADKLIPVVTEIKNFYAGATPAANTFIGVQALARPEFLVEIEATAALD